MLTPLVYSINETDDKLHLSSTTTRPQGLHILFLGSRQALAPPVHRLIAIPSFDSLQLPLRLLQFLLQPLNLLLLLHPILFQPANVLHQHLILLLAHGCNCAFGVLGHFEEAENGGIVAHGI